MFEALQRAPALLREIELTYPSTIQGRAHAWRFELPGVDLAGVVGRDAPAQGLRSSLAEQPYVAEMALDDERTMVELVIRPR